jgi:hypothetical protein
MISLEKSKSHYCVGDRCCSPGRNLTYGKKEKNYDLCSFLRAFDVKGSFDGF